MQNQNPFNATTLLLWLVGIVAGFICGMVGLAIQERIDATPLPETSTDAEIYPF